MADIFIAFSPSAGGLFRLAIDPDDAAALASSLDAMGSSGAAIFGPDGQKVGGCALYGSAADGSIIVSLNLFDTSSAEKIAGGVYVGAVLNTETPGLILTDSPLTKGVDGRLQKLDGQQSGLAFAKRQMQRADVKEQLRKLDRDIGKQGENLAKAVDRLAGLSKRLEALERLPAVPGMPIRHHPEDAIGV